MNRGRPLVFVFVFVFVSLLLVACGGGSSSGGGSAVVTGLCVEERPIAKVAGTSDFFNICDFIINIAFVFGEGGLVGDAELAPEAKAFGLSSNRTPPIACRAPSIPVFMDGKASCS